MKASRRKVILINRKFQLNIIAHFIGLSLISIAAFYAANFWFFYQFVKMGQEMNLPPDHVFYHFIHAQEVQMNWIFIGVSLLVTVFLIIGGTILSHKVAGPIYRLCQHLKGIKEGDEVKPLAFRDGDYFPEITEHINPILERVVRG